MTTENNEVIQSPAPSSTWSGPASGDRSILTFDSSNDSDPNWREPTQRLNRWKHRVAQAMSLLRKEGKEGIDAIQRQELRAKGRVTDLLMSDGSQLPDDLGFWKARHEYFVNECRQIMARKGQRYPSIRDSINPRLFWIYNWVSDTQAARDADRPDTSETAMCERQLSEPPTARATKKGLYDMADGSVEGDTLPSKQPRRDPAKTKRPRDTADGAEESDTLPSKRPRHDPLAEQRLDDMAGGAEESDILLSKPSKRDPLAEKRLVDTADGAEESDALPSKRLVDTAGRAEESDSLPSKRLVDMAGGAEESDTLPSKRPRRDPPVEKRTDDTAGGVEESDALPSKQPRRDPAIKKRPRDTADGAEESNTLPSKRLVDTASRPEESDALPSKRPRRDPPAEKQFDNTAGGAEGSDTLLSKQSRRPAHAEIKAK